MKILASDGIDAAGKELLENAGFEVVVKSLTPPELLSEIKNYDGIIVRSATKVTKEVIDAGNLKAIGRAGVGVDNIDVAYAKEKGIPVLNTPAASSASVAELAIAHLFAVARFINVSNVEMRNGVWNKKAYSEGFELTGKTFGLIGCGKIGQETAKRALALGMNVIAFDQNPDTSIKDIEFVDFDNLLVNADVISLHIPASKSGYVIGEEQFNKMKDGAVLINCSRGGTVDEKALLNALKSGKIAGAGLDVFEQEPAGEAQKDIIEHPRVSSTPHIGGSTKEAQFRVGIEIAERMIAALKV